MDTEGDTRWICAACGTRHDTNERPCRNCASEQFAKLEEPDAYQIDEAASVTWVCDGCGKESPQNTTQCRNCGSFSYTKKSELAETDHSPAPGNVPAGAQTSSRQITLKLLVAYAGSLLALLNAVGALLVGHASVLLFAGALLVSLPPVKRRFENRGNVTITTAAAVGIYVVFTLVGNFWLALAL